MHLSPLNRLNLKLKYYQFREACQDLCLSDYQGIGLATETVQDCIHDCVYEPSDERYHLIRAAAPTSHNDNLYALSPPRSPSPPSPPHDKEKNKTPPPKNTELVEDVRSTFFLVSQLLTLELKLQRNVQRGAETALRQIPVLRSRIVS